MTYSLTYGSYTLPRGFHVLEVPAGRVATMAKLPRAHGARVVSPSYLEGKRIRIEGGLSQSGFKNSTDIRADLVALRAALALGPKNFTTENDRYLRNCVLADYMDTYEPKHWGRIVEVHFALVAGDPFTYAVTPSTADLVATTNTAVVGGNAPALPIFTLTMASTATLGLTLTNTNTGDVCNLAGAVVNADVLVIDSLNQTVKKNGVLTMSMFEGLWLTLQAGATNTFTLALGSGTIGAKSVDWSNRWY